VCLMRVILLCDKHLRTRTQVRHDHISRCSTAKARSPVHTDAGNQGLRGVLGAQTSAFIFAACRLENLCMAMCHKVRTWGPMPKTMQTKPATCRASAMLRRSHAVAIMPSRICCRHGEIQMRAPCAL